MDFFWIKHRRQLALLDQLAKRPDSAQQLAEICIFNAKQHLFITLQLVLKYKKFYKQFVNNHETSIRYLCKLITATPIPYALDVLLHPEIARHLLEQPNIAHYLCHIACVHLSIANAFFISHYTPITHASEESKRLLQKMRKALFYDQHAAHYINTIMVTHKAIAIEVFQRSCQAGLNPLFQRAYRVEENPIQLIFRDAKKYDYLAKIIKSYHLDRYIQRTHNDPNYLLATLDQAETCTLFLHTLLASQINDTPQLDISPISTYAPERQWKWHPSILLSPIMTMPATQQIR